MKNLIFCSLSFALFFLPGTCAGFTPGNLFVVNQPSSASAGEDYILEIDPAGFPSGRIIDTALDISGMRDLAFDPASRLLLYTVSNYWTSTFEIRQIDDAERLIRTDVMPNSGGGNIELVFAQDHTLFIAYDDYIYRRLPDETDIQVFMELPDTGIGDLDIDANGNLYLSDPFINDVVYQIQPDGTYQIYAGPADGLNSPYGIAMGKDGTLFVANSRTSAPAIIKIPSNGAAEVFSKGYPLSGQILDLAFDQQGYLFASIRSTDRIIKFDRNGNGSIFADKTSELHDPAAMAFFPLGCRQDFDMDGDVDGSDLAGFIAEFNPVCLYEVSMAFGNQEKN